jgi:hypothetical protein
LNSRTEKTTPKDRPSDDRIRREERQRSHCSASNISQPFPNLFPTNTHALSLHIRAEELTFSFKRASETGLLGRETGGGAIDVSGIFVGSYNIYQIYFRALRVQLTYRE